SDPQAARARAKHHPRGQLVPRKGMAAAGCLPFRCQRSRTLVFVPPTGTPGASGTPPSRQRDSLADQRRVSSSAETDTKPAIGHETGNRRGDRETARWPGNGEGALRPLRSSPDVAATSAAGVLDRGADLAQDRADLVAQEDQSDDGDDRDEGEDQR